MADTSELCSGLILASRLKALGVSCILIEKNKKVGDNWALRYDNLRFHIGNGFCETPYLRESKVWKDRQRSEM